MEAIHMLESIEPAAFDALLHQYPAVVQDKLANLDQQRYKTIPEAVKDRTDSPCLEKDEVATLVDWKL